MEIYSNLFCFLHRLWCLKSHPELRANTAHHPSSSPETTFPPRRKNEKWLSLPAVGIGINKHASFFFGLWARTSTPQHLLPLLFVLSLLSAARAKSAKSTPAGGRGSSAINRGSYKLGTQKKKGWKKDEMLRYWNNPSRGYNGSVRPYKLKPAFYCLAVEMIEIEVRLKCRTRKKKKRMQVVRILGVQLGSLLRCVRSVFLSIIFRLCWTEGCRESEVKKQRSGVTLRGLLLNFHNVTQRVLKVFLSYKRESPFTVSRQIGDSKLGKNTQQNDGYKWMSCEDSS